MKEFDKKNDENIENLNELIKVQQMHKLDNFIL